MGTLIAKKYPTKLFLKAADHTYVECSTGGKGWACWGGKSGGTAFNRGSGSTRRADAIAGSNERAGITCYLVNGVCHQAANRILVAAGVLVSAARGYALSQAVFGPYGRAGNLPCSSVFNQHVGVTGDLAACTAVANPVATRAAMANTPKLVGSPADAAHIRSIKSMYNRVDPKALTAMDAIEFNIHVFERELSHRFGEALNNTSRQGLRLAKTAIETAHHQLSTDWVGQTMSPEEYIKTFNRLTDRFQDDCANALAKKPLYRRLLELDLDERVVLADPDAVDQAFGEGTARRVYGKLLSTAKAEARAAAASTTKPKG
jgi:hypothetical protein